MKIITEEDYINIANYIIRNIKSYGEEWNLSLNDLIVKLKSMKINFVDSISDLYPLKGGACIAYYCKQCGDVYFSPNSFRVHKIPTFSKFLCFRCLRKQTNVERFGTDNPMKNKDIVAKGQETWAKKSPEELQNIYNRVAETRKNKTQEEKDEIKRKVKESKLRNSGDPNAGCFGSKEFKAGMVKKYGVDVPAKNHEIAARISNTLLSKTQEEKQATRNKTITNNLAKYGYEWHTQVPEIIEKINQATISKLGVKRALQLSKYVNDMQDTMLKRYGGKTSRESPMLLNKIRETMLKTYSTLSPSYKYIYYGINLDSSWELAVWIYCIDHNIPIIRNVYTHFTYEDAINNKHNYYPDFTINGKLVEIKGGQFWKSDGTMCYPFNTKKADGKYVDLDPKERAFLDDIYERKHQCGLSHGVEFWKQSDCQKYLDYCNIMYPGWDKLYRRDNIMNPTYWCNIFLNPGYHQPQEYIPSIIKATPFNLNPDSDGFIMSDKSITPFDIK